MALKRTQRQFSVEEVAKYLGGLHPNAVNRLLDSGELGYYKTPDRRLIGLYHLARYIKRTQQKAKY